MESFEMQDRASDPTTTGDSNAYVDTTLTDTAGAGFDEPAYTEVSPDATPSWADNSSVPPGISQEDLAPEEWTEALINRWRAERGQVLANLEFASSTKGELWLRWGREWLRLTHKNNPREFLAPSTIQKEYRVDVARALGVYESTADASMGRVAVEALSEARQESDKEAKSIGTEPIETIELQNLEKTADKAVNTTHEIVTTLTGAGVSDREVAGLLRAFTRVRDELANNVARLSEEERDVEETKEHIALERRKLTETDDEGLKRDIRSRIAALEDKLSDQLLKRASRLELLSANREDLRSQFSRMRETIDRILHEDTTLAERIRTLFREQGITIASVLTALGMAISTLVLALTGGGGGGGATPPPPSDKGGLKEWVKKHLRSLGRVLARLAGKAAAALPGIIGSIVSWLLGTLGKAAGWLATNLWALVVVVGGLLLVAAREWLTKPKRE